MPRKHESCKWSVNMQQVYEPSIIVVALQNVWMSNTLQVNVSCIEIEIHVLLDDSTFFKSGLFDLETGFFKNLYVRMKCWLYLLFRMMFLYGSFFT